jgi:hypothetical protein
MTGKQARSAAQLEALVRSELEASGVSSVRWWRIVSAEPGSDGSWRIAHSRPAGDSFATALDRTYEKLSKIYDLR